jgi:hypothetical protein
LKLPLCVVVENRTDPRCLHWPSGKSMKVNHGNNEMGKIFDYLSRPS